MTDLLRPSPFIDLAAVEAWDAWFRWREQADLRDFSIEDTWRRVATALASVEAGGEIATWRMRFTDAFAAWRLLPDECLLADAGTGRTECRNGTLHASVNAAAFVSAGQAAGATIDLVALGDCAALAVRALDNAALLAGIASPCLRIGMLGVADALALLDLRYDSEPGRAQAAAMAKALAEGCLRGNIALAAERGVCGCGAGASLARAGRRVLPEELLRDAARRGVRHAQLTAITSQPRLALLANNVADAVDPLWGMDHAHVIAASDGHRTLRSSGYALNILHAWGREPGAAPTPARPSWMAQIAMRAALQPWMDEPIDYPLLATDPLDDSQRLEARKLAATYGLGEPAWRDEVAPQPL